MTPTKADEKRFNDTLKRMLRTPPTPHENKTVNRQLTKPNAKGKPDGHPAKNNRPEEDG